MARFFFFLSTIIICSTLFFSGSSFAADWNYDQIDKWEEVSETCGKGKKQSPININNEVASDITLKVNYNKLQPTEIVNNGHTVEVRFKKGYTITYKRKNYELIQLHFHIPSEHTVAGKSYPMEAHFVHGNSDGTLAVIGVFFQAGRKNNALDELIRGASSKQETKNYTKILDIKELLPISNHVFTYGGSLTTPPCSENVTWLVKSSVLEMSQSQINSLKQKIGLESNNRPIQNNPGSRKSR